MTLVAWQERVIEEADELSIKCDKLSEFIDTDTYDELEQVQQAKLITQAYFMNMYYAILNDRIIDFTVDEEEKEV